MSKKGVFTLLAVMIVAAAMYFAGLGSYPLLDPDEGRYAEIPREMLESGDFITPRLNYVKYFEKPPLYYWLTAGSMALFGQNERAVRVVPAVAGFLTLMLIAALGIRLFEDEKTGILGAWIYLTSLVPVILARLPIIDGVFSLFLTATWGAWWLGYQAPSTSVRRGWYCVSWAFLGLSVMTKGIAAIALTGLITGVFLICRRDWRAILTMAWIPGLLIFALITVPWHWAVSARNPEFFHFYIVVQHFSRLVSYEHAKPFWFFLVVFPFGMLCWTGLFFPAAVRSIKSFWNTVSTPATGSRQHQGILFLVIWAAAVVGLFSISRCKIVPYILPAYPAMALLVAHFVRENGHLKKTAGLLTALLAALLLTGLFMVSPQARGQNMLPFAALRSSVLAGQVALLAGGLLLGVSVWKRRLIPFATGVSLVLLLPAMLTVVPTVAQYRKVGGFIKAMDPLPLGITIAEWRSYDQALTFYARRRTVLVDEVSELAFGRSVGNHDEYFLKGAESLKRLAEKGPLLVNIRPEDWPRVQRWGTLKVACANSTNIMVANDGFFRLTGLLPWPEGAVTPPPLLLLPKKAQRSTGPAQ